MAEPTAPTTPSMDELEASLQSAQTAATGSPPAVPAAPEGQANPPTPPPAPAPANPPLPPQPAAKGKCGIPPDDAEILQPHRSRTYPPPPEGFKDWDDYAAELGVLRDAISSNRALFFKNEQGLKDRITALEEERGTVVKQREKALQEEHEAALNKVRAELVAANARITKLEGQLRQVLAQNAKLQKDLKALKAEVELDLAQ